MGITMGKTKNSIKGGSIASSRVNTLVVKEIVPKPKLVTKKITPEFIEKNYGIEYKTTGGKKKSRNNKKGGSIASSRVNSLIVKKSIPQLKEPCKKITPEFIERNYGIEYKTTGGKKKKYGLPERYFDPNINKKN